MAESIFIARQGNLLVALRAEHSENDRWNEIARSGHAAFREADFTVDFVPLLNAQHEIGGFQFYTHDDMSDRQITAAFKDCVGYIAQKHRHYFYLGTDDDLSPYGKQRKSRYWINSSGEVLVEISRLRTNFTQPIDFPTISMSSSELKSTKKVPDAVSDQTSPSPRAKKSLWARLFGGR